MKQTEWKIIYTNYENVQKRAVDFLSKEAGRYLIREENIYRIHVLPCEKEGAAIPHSAMIVGLYHESETVRKYVKADEFPADGFLIKVIENPENTDGRLIILTANSAAELFYAAVSFIDDYIPEYSPWHGSNPMPQFIFDAPLHMQSYTERPANRTRSVFTWGHPINDYRAYIDNLARQKFNQVIIWNNYMPLNAKDVIEYAHAYGMEVLFGYAWGWTPGCSKIKDASEKRLKELKEEIIREYEENYAKIGCDGIYFQSFTERSDEYIDGRLIAEAVTTLVNDAAGTLFEQYSDIKLQFGLHAMSVKNHLDEIAKVDKRVEILWEDCGEFPYSYRSAVTDEKAFEETLAFTKKILHLRGNAPVGWVIKGVMMLDWTKFIYQSGPVVLGENAQSITDHDHRLRAHAWRLYSADWLRYGKYVAKTLQFIQENALGDVNMCLAGTFEGGIRLPQALCAQMFRHLDESYEETLQKVVRRNCITFA